MSNYIRTIYSTYTTSCLIGYMYVLAPIPCGFNGFYEHEDLFVDTSTLMCCVWVYTVHEGRCQFRKSCRVVTTYDIGGVSI